MPLSTTHSQSKRVFDLNGWAEIKDNPLSKVGVFPYLGRQISGELDPDKIYNVYRPEEELNNPETIDSFRLLPWTDEHTMLGSEDEGLTPAEKKGVHGVIGEDVYFEDGYLKANLKVFSDKLADLIESGKKELSIGYRCLYELTNGAYNGQHYDAIQRNIRGNHLALVDEGRAGPEVAVLDHFKFTFDAKELYLMEENGNAESGEMTLESLAAQLKSLAGLVETLMAANGAKAEDVEPDDFVSKAEVTDADEEKKDDEKKAEDADEEKKDDGMGMDAQIKALNRKVSALEKANTKSLLIEVSQRDNLARSLSQHIGTFDHADKTLSEVAEYGVRKLGLTSKPGHEMSVLNGYLAAAKVARPVAMDRKVESGAVMAYLNTANGGK